MTWVDATILEIVQETPLDRSFVLAVPPAQRDAFAFVPGQYLQLRDPADPSGRDWYFSLSAAPNDEGTLRITVRGRGEPVQRIYAAPAGTVWHALPPAGALRIAAPDGERVVLAGAGSGVTPYRAFVEQRVRAGDEDPVVLLQSARTPEDLLFLEEFRAWSDAAKAFTHVPTVTSDAGDWSGRRGRIDADLLREAVGDPETVHVFACGPGDFVDTVLDLAADLGVPPARRLRERY